MGEGAVGGSTFAGRVVAIFTAPSAGAAMEAHDDVRALTGVGLDGDRYALGTGKYSATKVGKRNVTLIEREAIAGAANEYGVEISEQETRRNLVTEGVALNHLVGREFRVGDVLFEGFDLSEPCKYLEDLTRSGVRAPLVHRGGLRAIVRSDGLIRVGDPIVPV
jgi:MOSC domain-containing protein YiiM